ncbi:hypothetical protein J437_LFUL008951 [Ladona fulva]|uniref:Aminotransferase class V domain-containing protein n=1 Tax=Ladona fulva TaxID=123851 RepID=A0A8K0KIZ9_LADFU|nr:hypothetical protein J437_LFUL008951 [Ladona fulva]
MCYKKLLCQLFYKNDCLFIASDFLASANSPQELRPLYLDAQATTPLDPRVLDAMLPYLTSCYGNPHSRTHAYGWESEHAVEDARKKVANLIHCDPKEIIFTSGATECNNIAVKGVARFYASKKKHIITTQTPIFIFFEYTFMLKVDYMVWSLLFCIFYLLLNSLFCEFCWNLLKFLYGIETYLNNFPQNFIILLQLSLLRRNIYFFLIYFFSHKELVLCIGGGQERGMRSGTVPTPLVVGLGAACEISEREMEEHKCVLDSCRALEAEGFSVTYLPVGKSTGMVDLAHLEEAIRPDTSLVSIMAVNNEIGVKQRIKEIGANHYFKKKILVKS